MKEIIHVSGHPYYFHRIVHSWNAVQAIRHAYPKCRYYYVKTWGRNGPGYAVYLDRWVKGC